MLLKITADAADFVGGVLPLSSLSFADGEYSKTITVSVQGDEDVESNEAFTVNLSNASTGADIVVGTANGVQSDDVEWTIAALSIPSAEGDGTSNYVYRVTRSGNLAATTLDWSVAGGLVPPAPASSAISSRRALWCSHKVRSSQDFTVADRPAAGVLEADEGFTVTLAAPADSLTRRFRTQGVDTTIVNDDDVMSIAPLAAGSARKPAARAASPSRSRAPVARRWQRRPAGKSCTATPTPPISSPPRAPSLPTRRPRPPPPWAAATARWRS